nr:AMP-binding protein [uncultured Chryseobacterium sp.]
MLSSYLQGTSDVPLLGQTIGENLKNTVEKFPHREALVCVHQNYRATYLEFYNQTTAVAKALLHLGVQAGDRIGIWSANRYEWVLIQYATARIGTILVNINPAYRLNELTYVLNQSGIRFIFSSLQFKTSNYKEMVEYAKNACPALENTIFFDDNWKAFVNEGQHISDEVLHSYEEQVQFDDPVNIQYTSGTTGFPKGVTLSHHNILNNGYLIGIRLKYTEKDRVCIPLPFYHCFAMVGGNICCTTHGACMVVPNDNFDPEITLQTVSDEKCTSLYGVPTMFIAELAVKDFDKHDLSSLRTGIMGGSMCPTEIVKKIIENMGIRDISLAYGMTETSAASIQTFTNTSYDKLTSTIGMVHDHLEIKIVTPEGRILERGKEGELCVRGYAVMLKYWNDPENTKEVIDASRWMHSGDMAVMDKDGYITISGRIKDLIIRGGENISPKEIEDFLHTYTNIMDVQIVGVPSEKFGEEVMAWIKVRKGFTITEEELLEYCKRKIAHYKVPKYWKFVDEFPMTISGKIRKVEMREISMKELGLESRA